MVRRENVLFYVITKCIKVKFDKKVTSKLNGRFVSLKTHVPLVKLTQYQSVWTPGYHGFLMVSMFRRGLDKLVNQP